MMYELLEDNAISFLNKIKESTNQK